MNNRQRTVRSIHAWLGLITGIQLLFWCAGVRGRTLPAWQVKLTDVDNTHVYVDQATGTVASRQNDAWRQFDFFWMLHTMDYSGRDNFNTPWLIGFSVLGLLSVSSGWDIWVFRFARARKRQPA